MGERKTEPARGRLIACALLSAVLAILGALASWSVVDHMLKLDLLLREGMVVHGGVTGKRAEDRDSILPQYTVEYGFWPDRDFDKPYQRAKPLSIVRG